MAWLTLSQTESRVFHGVIHEIEGGSPRAAAIVGGASVEEHLTKLLRWRMIKERIKSGIDLQDKVFHPSGPLGDFGNKLNLAYLLGFISKDAWKELDTIRLIRNKFAHYPEINRWDIKDIINRCDKLTMWERVKIKFHIPKGEKMSITMGTSIEEATSNYL